MPISCFLAWTGPEARAEQGQHGEIDIVVLNQARDVLLMQVKSGSVDFRPDGIFKRYGGYAKVVNSEGK